MATTASGPYTSARFGDFHVSPQTVRIKSLSSPKPANPRARQADSHGAVPPPNPIYLEQQENCKGEKPPCSFLFKPEWQREALKTKITHLFPIFCKQLICNEYFTDIPYPQTNQNKGHRCKIPPRGRGRGAEFETQRSSRKRRTTTHHKKTTSHHRNTTSCTRSSARFTRNSPKGPCISGQCVLP